MRLSKFGGRQLFKRYALLKETISLKGCLPQNLLSPLLNPLPQVSDLQVLRKCISWAPRNGAMEKFSLTPNRSMVLDVLQEYVL